MPSSAPGRQTSLLDTRALPIDEISALFNRADEFKTRFAERGDFRDGVTQPKVVCCLFFEPSTRTRMSFQTAAYRLGHQVLTMELSSSSLVKGETYTDTVLNIAAMFPDLLIVRYANSPELDKLLPELDMPVINAGSGVDHHPTQALLDAYTIRNEFGVISGKRILIVGDIAHSRVARSNFDVLGRLGAEIAIAGPQEFLPSEKEFSQVKRFESLDEALDWPDVFMGLRVQKERHGGAQVVSGSAEEYHRDFGLTSRRLKKLKPHTIIMHPGPINYGVEFSNPQEILEDRRNRILQQVSNGVLIRAVLLDSFLAAASEND